MKIRSLFVLTIIAALLGMATACDDFLKDPNSTGTDNDLPGENPNLQPDSQNYTVSFAANGGSPAPQNQTVSHGGKATEPAAITKAGYDFGGWYKEVTLNNQWDFNSDTVTGNIVLYAKWGYTTPPITVQGNTLAEKLRWLIFNAENNGNYVFELTAIYEPLPPQTLFYAGRSNISIQLKGIGNSDRVIELEPASNDSYGYASLFTVGNGVTLILDSNIALFGKYDYGNNRSLITVNSGGSLILNQGAKISGNNGNGVYVQSGTFTMNGGEISGNTSGAGGGVYVDEGTFTMNGGVISGNTASRGGGVYVNEGTFTMTGGEISGNTGSGVNVGGGTFTMSGGEISGNIAGMGGGVCVQSGTFTMSGGVISGNTADRGGGVCVQSGTFTMTGGVILGNTADMGGGICLGTTRGYRETVTFTMTGGEISGNTASYGGGGVYVSNDGYDYHDYHFIPFINFEKTGGIITGYSSDTVNGNVVKDSNGNVLSNSGHAVAVVVSYYYPYSDFNSVIRYKNTTAGQGDNFTFITNEQPPTITISGAWDE